MFATRPFRVWSLLLGLCVVMPVRLAQSREKELVEDVTSGLRMEQVRHAPDDPGDQSLNPDYCDFTFHVPWSGSFCTPTIQAYSPASQEELDHLKTTLEDIGGALKTLQGAATLEAGNSTYQDIISEALPDVREANMAFHETLAKFLQELEDHIQADDHPHLENEKKKLTEHLRMMDHMIQVTGHLAEQLDQESQNLLETLTRPLEKPPALVYGRALQPS
ncbi:uncharacterized protein LOC133384570 [Rhineura floridana]|uniref:uncharacterized protein LOC133384570 n=1 Tax=Rhineura floridana TaxID=261503 RepID=UPI002AC7EB6D|nr:uncharacterized protein LOC133384570 [Rhineura floridana]